MAESRARVAVDRDGNVVDEGSPEAAAILRGADAEAALKKRHRGAEHAADADAEAKAQEAAPDTKARTRAPENKGR